jgi:hypothetical protein
MPGRGRCRKRKAVSQPAADEFSDDSRLRQPGPGNFERVQEIDFDAILRASNIIPCNDNMGCGGRIDQAPRNEVLRQYRPGNRDSEPMRLSIPPVVAAPAPQLQSNGDFRHTRASFPSSHTELTRLAHDDIAAHVPTTLKQQIARGGYVQIALLLKGAVDLADYGNGSELRLSNNGVIEARPRECKDKVNHIERWTDAFLIFASVYLASHPGKTYELLHYMWTIRECAARQGGFAWREYDEQFRLRQAISPSSWAYINNDLWWRCVQVRGVGPSTDMLNKTTIRSCNAFNEGRCMWLNCKFSHVCSECGQQHAAINCTRSTTGLRSDTPALELNN